ncbi:hypothetical protein [Kitasatospora sp. NPDC057223]|uniref:hypothetical protein n=1 Tax=Kitasatospora sp. NPDC057223 TaxID=3346055 RepID=UPI0036375C3C
MRWKRETRTAPPAAAESGAADTALTDTARRLGETRAELLAARTDLATLRGELAAAQQLARQASAGEARARALEQLLLRDAGAQAADRDRTIAGLRAELEQTRAVQLAAVGLPEHTVARFLTLGGGLVALLAVPDEDRYESPPVYGYECLTCGHQASGAYRIADGRRWANEHASTCRALPAPVIDLPVQKGATR